MLPGGKPLSSILAEKVENNFISIYNYLVGELDLYPELYTQSSIKFSYRGVKQEDGSYKIPNYKYGSGPCWKISMWVDKNTLRIEDIYFVGKCEYFKDRNFKGDITVEEFLQTLEEMKEAVAKLYALT